MRRCSLRVLSLAAILLLAGSAAAATRRVQVGPGGSFVFSPASVTIDVGDTVEWVWNNGPPHTTTRTQSPESWDSGIASAPNTFSHTFGQPGRFPYVCTLHVALGMTGTVVVRSDAMSTSTTVQGSSTTSTSTPGPLASCQGVSACVAELMAALPSPADATTGRERKTARSLQRLGKNAAHQLERAVAASGARRTRLASKSRNTLERLRTAADRAAAKGTLHVPVDQIDAVINSLLALGQAG